MHSFLEGVHYRPVPTLSAFLRPLWTVAQLQLGDLHEYMRDTACLHPADCATRSHIFTETFPVP